MMRSFTTNVPEEMLSEQLRSAGIDQDVLQRAREAAAAILKDAGVPALVDGISIRHAETPERAAACRCRRYETRCYTIVECDDTGCRPVTRCYQECVEWECPA
jgi:hypothetical protein